MSTPAISGIMPFFMVDDLPRTVEFYGAALGFDTSFMAPDPDPFFAIVTRDKAALMLKAVSATPQPNSVRDPDARWDAFVSAPDPDALASEFESRGVVLHVSLGNTDDGLRGFEVRDPDGHVLFFGRPR